MIITKRFTGIIRELPRTCCPTTHFEMHAGNCHSTAWLVDESGKQIDEELAAKRLIGGEEKPVDPMIKAAKIAAMGALGYHRIPRIPPPKKPQDFIWTFRGHSNFSNWHEPIYLNGAGSNTLFQIREIVLSPGFPTETTFRLYSYNSCTQRSFEIPFMVFDRNRFKLRSELDADGIGNWSLEINKPQDETYGAAKPISVALVGVLT